MAEALAGVAAVSSVIAIIQITGSIITTCKTYIDIVKDVPSDLHLLLVELTTLKTLFEVLNSLTEWNAGVSTVIEALSSRDGPVEGCRRSLAELQKLIPASWVDTARDKAQPQSKKRKVKNAVAVFAWPFKESKVRKLLGEISQYKETITIALMTNSAQHVLEIKSKTSDIYEKLTDTRRHEVYRWLQHTDPSPLHHRAQKNYETGTGNWILRYPDWTAWLEAKRRCLWIHGVPGAGKTVLMSHLVEQVKEYCEISQTKTAFVYYYCYFGHNQDEAAPFLRWLLNQLCRQQVTIPNRVYQMYRYGGEPSLEDLIKALADILALYDVVYVLCDAIDESSPREDLLRVLRDFVTDLRFSKLQVLASSREYIDIENVMEKIATPLSMANPAVEEDIRRAVHSTLQSHPQFKHWPEDLLMETEIALATGAKGMFRWAVCQIDALRRLKPELTIIQTALANLPATLFETYDRIIIEISQEERQFVYHALQWISFSNEVEPYEGVGIPPATLLQGVERSIDWFRVRQNERFYDKWMLLELCGCLISTQSQHGDDKLGLLLVSYAHYTVREWLSSTRIFNSSCTKETNCSEGIQLSILEIILSEAVRFELPGPGDANAVDPAPDQSLGAYSVICTISSIIRWTKEITQTESLFQSVIDFLDPFRSNYHAFQKVASNFDFWSFDVFGSPDYNYIWKIEWQTTSENNKEARLLSVLILPFTNESDGLALIAAVLQCIGPKELCQTKLSFRSDSSLFLGRWSSFGPHEFKGSVIEIFALTRFSVKQFKLLLEYGVGFFNASKVLLLCGHGHRHAYPPCNYTGLCPIKLLLEMGANPNAKEYELTPLQIAVAVHDIAGTRILLKAGAKPNDAGKSDDISLGDYTILNDLQSLRNLTPLQICRRHRLTMPWLKRVQADIERLLLEYGAQGTGPPSQDQESEDDPIYDSMSAFEETDVDMSTESNEHEA